MKSEFDYFLSLCPTYYNMIHQCDVYHTTHLCTQNSVRYSFPVNKQEFVSTPELYSCLLWCPDEWLRRFNYDFLEFSWHYFSHKIFEEYIFLLAQWHTTMTGVAARINVRVISSIFFQFHSILSYSGFFLLCLNFISYYCQPTVKE